MSQHTTLDTGHHTIYIMSVSSQLRRCRLCSGSGRRLLGRVVAAPGSAAQVDLADVADARGAVSSELPCPTTIGVG